MIKIIFNNKNTVVSIEQFCSMFLTLFELMPLAEITVFDLESKQEKIIIIEDLFHQIQVDEKTLVEHLKITE